MYEKTQRVPARTVEPKYFWDGNKLVPNPKKTTTYPFWLTLDPQNGDSDITNLDPNTSTDRVIKNDLSGVLEIIAIAGEATSDNYTLRFIDDGSSIELSKNNLHAETVVGTRLFPYRLPAPIFLMPDDTLSLSVLNLHSSQNTIRLFFYCKKYERPDLVFPKGWELNLKSKKPYFYTTDQPLIVPTNDTKIGQFTISTESNFWLKSVQARSTGLYRVKIVENKTERGLQTNWIRSTLFAGNAQNHFEYDEGEEVFFKSRTLIEIQVNDLSGAENRIFVTFAGIQFYGQKQC